MLVRTVLLGGLAAVLGCASSGAPVVPAASRPGGSSVSAPAAGSSPLTSGVVSLRPGDREPATGRITVSGPDILVDGQRPAGRLFGVVDTTALQHAIMAYLDGQTNVAGKTSVFNGPDTSDLGPVAPNGNAEVFWLQYFALMRHYDVNLVRVGAGDAWGSRLQYEAWANHREAYLELLRTMLRSARSQGVWVVLVHAGSQEYPTFSCGGSGSVFDRASSAFDGYVTYVKDVMSALEDENGLAWHDLFNEPDHDRCDAGFWNGDKVRFNAWSRAVAALTGGVTTHPRTMGVAGLGSLFGLNRSDFDLATGTGGFEIAHLHYYASNEDPANFVEPERWARQNGKPLFWGELGYNGVYPLRRYTFAEQTIFANGGQAITSMVLTGTDGYPYAGGAL